MALVNHSRGNAKYHPNAKVHFSETLYFYSRKTVSKQPDLLFSNELSR